LVWTFRTRNTPFLPAGIVTPDIPKLTKVGVKQKVKVKVKVTLEEVTNFQRGSRGIALLFL